MKNSVVVITPINKNYKQALDKIFKPFPEIIKKIKKSKNIFIKICIDHYYNHLYTDLDLLGLILKYFRYLNPSAKIFVMENNIHGNFNRLLTNELGIKRLTRQYKAKFIYLDEKKSAEITLGKPENLYPIQFPRILLDYLIFQREKKFYLNLAMLKTHYQTKIAAGLFNQIGFISPQSHHFIHLHHIHQTIVDLLHYIRPDFTIIDANVVLAHGVIPPECLIEKYANPVNHLIGGIDSVSVDCIALRALDYNPLEIEHIKLAIAEGLGEGDLDFVEIKGEIPSPPVKITHSLELKHLPPRLDIIIGNEKIGIEDCLGNLLQFAQIIYKDFLASKGFTLVAGSHFSKKQLNHLREPIILLGDKTCKELVPFFSKNYREVYYIDHCDDLHQIIAVLVKVMGTSKYHLLGFDPLTVWRHLFIGKLRGLKYKLPSIERKTKYRKFQQKKEITK